MFFYEKFVGKKYTIYKSNEKLFESLEETEIERIALYDSRHIAIINAIFLGYDIQSIQRLARHESVDTTYGYFQHQHEYTKSFAIAFSKKLLYKHEIKNMPVFNKTSTRGKLLTTIVLPSNNNNSIKRKSFESCGGYCEYDTNDDISFCMKF